MKIFFKLCCKIRSFTCLSIWDSMTAANRNGDEFAPNITHLYLKTRMGLFGSKMSFGKKNLNTSLSASLSTTFKKAFSMSEHAPYLSCLNLSRSLHMFTTRLGPVYRQSLRLTLVLFSLQEASITILRLVVLLSDFLIPLCGR